MKPAEADADCPLEVPGLRWLGHSCVLLEGPPAVYIDPWRLEGRKGLPRAALVLITHAHFDHASHEDVAWIASDDTVVAGPADALAGMPGVLRPVVAGDVVEHAGVRAVAIPAGDRPGGFHPPGSGVGWVVEGAGPRLAHAGDTALPLPVLDPPPDVLAIPVSGGTVFTPEAAADAAAATGAPTLLPIHWGDLQGGWFDAAAFRDRVRGLVPDVAVILRPRGRPDG